MTNPAKKETSAPKAKSAKKSGSKVQATPVTKAPTGKTESNSKPGKEGAGVAVPKAPAKVKDVENDVLRPGEGTATRAIWTSADELLAKQGSVPLRAEVVALAVEAGLNPNTAVTQYGRWVKYHGHSEAVANAKAAAAEKKKADLKATKELERAEKKKAKEDAKAEAEADKAAKKEDKEAPTAQ